MRVAGTATRSSTVPVVIDASALLELLLQTARGRAVRQAVAGDDLVATDLVNPEVLSVLRRLEASGMLTERRADQAVIDLCEAPLRRLPTTPLLDIAWRLRANLSAYDACHVALARVLGCPLVTGDLRLARAPSLGVSVLTV